MTTRTVEEQSFQDIYFSGSRVALTLGIVPHFEVVIGPEDVIKIRRLIEEASAVGASWNDQNGSNGDFHVERMKNSSSICFGEASLKNLTDSQWLAIYRILGDWLQWSLSAEGEEEFQDRVPADADAYVIFDTSNPKSEAARKQSVADTFSDNSITLTPKKRKRGGK